MSFRKKSLTLGCALGALALIAAAPAADLNGDSKVSAAEFTAHSVAKFDAADANRDGLLDSAEQDVLRSNRQSERRKKRFAKMDLNGDGAVTEAEIETRAAERGAKRSAKKAERLAKFDTNQDGQLDEAERAAAKQSRADGKRTEGRRAEGRRGEGKRGDKRKRPRLDTNSDGFVSRAEFITMSDTLFAKMDRNADGFLEKGEGRKRGKRQRRR